MTIFARIKLWLRGFSGRIFTGLVFAMLVMVFIFNLVFIDLQKKILTRQIIQNGKNKVKLLAYVVRLGVFAENKEQLQLPTEAVLSDKDVVGIFIFNQYGQLLYSKQRPGTMPDKTAPVNLLSNNFQPDSQKIVVELHDDFFCFWAPVAITSPSSPHDDFYFDNQDASLTKEVIGSVKIVTDKKVLHQAIKNIVTRGLLLTFIFLLMTILITLLVVKQASRPIEELLVKIREMNGKKEKGNEVDLLQHTFLELLDDLHNSFRTINDLKLNLEKKVAERTAELSSQHDALAKTNLQLTDTLAELRNTQSQLVQSEKMIALGRLAGGVAHEINNTTNFISGAVPSLKRLINEVKNIVTSYESMMTGQNHESEIKKLKKEGKNCRHLLEDVDILLTNISEGARRTGDIVRQLRNFSRQDENRAKPVDINESLDNTLIFVQPKYKNRITVARDYDPELSQVNCMTGKINQVFLNLLINAMQSISEEGTVTIKTWQQDKNVHILIKDSGSGIPPADLGKIFEPFFSRKDNGTGLGLAISYAIIEEHNGKIKVRSQPGSGTEFEIILPIQAQFTSYKGKEWKN